ncbi:hypothetical protein LHP98_08860 [Rhodobacter sp. Har01]|uniref:hypothetical protein n=1 Tax=Rhodobacter sp. Har01 TaxID=2883999 RepID=UPI001D096FEF|nr:hypothetical protein [Rhodobacter sp. Har01]MCB6178238.1 hypothetical protein [Rhodobacter sp. Har01]
MPLIDPKDPFFAKTWVRWSVTLVPLGWGLVEFATGSPGWGALFAAAGAYAGWVLLVSR